MRNICLLTLLLYLNQGVAAEIPAVVRDCLERNLPDSTSIQAIELRARDRTGYEQTLQSNVYLKRYEDGHARVMMHFNEPVDVRGARFLIIQQEPANEMYIYMPGLFKVRKITSSNITNSMLGTDFSYEDLERLKGVNKRMKMDRQTDEVQNGHQVDVENTQPPEENGKEKIEGEQVPRGRRPR